MDQITNNISATESESWKLPKHLCWKEGRTYSLEEAREALVGCFRHLLGTTMCNQELQSGGFGALIKNNPSRQFAESTILDGFEHLKQRASISCDPKLVLRSIFRLNFVINNLEGKKESAQVEQGPGKVYMIACENDIAIARDAAMRMAKKIGFSLTHGTSIATAVSELARNILRYAEEGRVALYIIKKEGQVGLKIYATDEGPGIPNINEILSGNYVSKTGMGLGMIGTKRLLDHFSVETSEGNGTRVMGIKYVR